MSRHPRNSFVERRPTYLDQLSWTARTDLERELHGEDVWREVADSYHLKETEIRNIEVQAQNQSVSASALLFQKLLFLDVTISNLCCRLVDLGFLPAARVLYPHANETAQFRFKQTERVHNPTGPVSSGGDRIPAAELSFPDDSAGSEGGHSTLPFAESERVLGWVQSLPSLASRENLAPESESGESQTSLRVNSRQIQSTQVVLPYFAYKKVYQATDGFSRDRLLGEGCFSFVYKADLDGTPLAVKVLNTKKEGLEGANFRELFDQSLCVFSYQHKHLLPLRGYTLGFPDCLVYEFMERGSLRRALDDRELSGVQRLRILDQTASALNYLHNRDTPVAHGKLSTTCILLDAHLDVKISGLETSQWVASGAMTCSDSVLTRSKESLFILPSECLRADGQAANVFTTTTDVYSLGVILLEMLTGLRAYDESRGDNRSFIAYFVFDGPASQCFSRRADDSARWTQLTFLSLLTLAAECLNDRDPSQRPRIDKIVEQLNLLPRDLAQ